MDKITFGMRVVQYTRTVLERQVLESVLIQQEGKKHNIMNSKSEYSSTVYLGLGIRSTGKGAAKNWRRSRRRKG